MLVSSYSPVLVIIEGVPGFLSVESVRHLAGSQRVGGGGGWGAAGKAAKQVIL